ncbi:YwqH-like family protein [Macrococcoides canis]|uniref:YwqH-like family protein n=1 Tax=Macrococcoides canis TaxID=1855823 RepID=UPI0020B89E45|nr:DUF5082 family protein [Macrococcus canis]UTG99572.1 DUF5082 family protein [Macrococcus canis]
MSKAQLRSELSSLRRRESSLNNAINSDKEKLVKLQNGLKAVMTGQSEYNNNKSKIDSTEIGYSEWQGENRREFDDKFEEFKAYLTEVHSEIETIVTTMQQDIRDLQTKIEINQLSLANVITSITSVESQLRKADD